MHLLLNLCLAASAVLHCQAGVGRPTDTACGKVWDSMVVKAQKKFGKSTPDGVKAGVIDGGYILAAFDKPYSLWVNFNCEQGQMKLTHCRVGNDDAADKLYLPVDQYYAVCKNNKKHCYPRDLNFGCLKSSPENILATIAPEAHTLGLVDEQRCHRVAGSDWCGMTADVAKGCREDFLKLMNGKWQNQDGMVPFNNEKDAKGYQIMAKFGCENKLLILKACSTSALVPWSFKPGEYSLYAEYYHVCPKAQPLKLKSEEEFANVGKSFIAVDSQGSKSLDGFTQKFPQGFTKECEAEWEKLTEKATWQSGDQGFARIAAGKELPKDQQREGKTHRDTLYGKFECAKGTKLKLQFCVEWDFFGKKKLEDMKHIPADECRNQDEKLKGF